MAVERPGRQRPDPRTRGALVGPGVHPAHRPRNRLVAWRVGRRTLLASSLVAAGGAWLVAEEVARGAASSAPHEWAVALYATALLGVSLPLLALLLWAAAGWGRLRWRRGRVRAAETRSGRAVGGVFVTLVVGLLPVLAARALFAGLSRLSWSAWRAVGDLARWPPPDAPLLGLLGGFTPLGVLGAAALVLLLLRCSPGGAGPGRRARPGAPYALRGRPAVARGPTARAARAVRQGGRPAGPGPAAPRPPGGVPPRADALLLVRPGGVPHPDRGGRGVRGGEAAAAGGRPAGGAARAEGRRGPDVPVGAPRPGRRRVPGPAPRPR